MILESKGTPDIIENIIDDNMIDIVNCVKKMLDLKLHINQTVENRNLKCEANVVFIQGKNYKGNINYIECLKSKFQNCIINVYFPKNYDLTLIIKTLTHELTHLYELYQINDKFDMTKWKWQEALDDIEMKNSFNNSHLLYFRDILYLSLPQELNARVSSIYFYLEMNSSKGDSKEQIIKLLYNSREWQNYNNLLDFNPEKLTRGMSQYYGQNISLLFFVINELNRKLGIDTQITNTQELNFYLRKIDRYFKKSANKYKNKLLRVVDRVFKEKNEKLEYLTNDPENVDYEEYIKNSKKEYRNKKLEILLEYSDFIKEISKNDN